jgi:ornithine carbamoyltransferase
MEHFINFKNTDAASLKKIIDLALQIKNNPEKYADTLQDKKLYMLFQKTSTRTALSFAFAMTGLGGEYFMQNWQDSNFGVGEMQDEIRYVSHNVDVIMARMKDVKDIYAMAKYSTAPVIDGCSNMYHPCQSMADLLTVKEKFGNFKVKFMYIGVRNNVLNSLMDSLPKLGGQLYAVTPIVNEPAKDDELYNASVKTGNFIDVGKGNPAVNEMKKLAKEMDVIYTDTWVDMEFINDKKFEGLKNERIAKMLPFQINQDLLKGSQTIVMHDMPIHAGYEISREVVEGHMPTILQQAENRKWAQMAVLITLLKSNSKNKE